MSQGLVHIGVIRRALRQSVIRYAAYVAGQRLRDLRTGEVYDYTRRQGVVSTCLVNARGLQPEGLWNGADRREKRRDSLLGRHIVVRLPPLLPRWLQIAVMRELAAEAARRWGVAVQAALHDRGKGNPHVHLVITRRVMTRDGLTNIALRPLAAAASGDCSRDELLGGLLEEPAADGRISAELPAQRRIPIHTRVLS